jgi:hypothetical protein
VQVRSGIYCDNAEHRRIVKDVVLAWAGKNVLGAIVEILRWPAT